MRKLLFTGMIVLFAIGSVFAGNSDLFQYDKQSLDNDFQNIDKLEMYVESNAITSYDDVLVNNANLSSDLATDGFVATPTDLAFGLGSVDWGSWAWGFCCWPVGIFTVILNSGKTYEQKTSYWIGLGCFLISGGGIWGVL